MTRGFHLINIVMILFMKNIVRISELKAKQASKLVKSSQKTTVLNVFKNNVTNHF